MAVSRRKRTWYGEVVRPRSGNLGWARGNGPRYAGAGWGHACATETRTPGAGLEGRGRGASSMASNIYLVRQRISRLGQVRPREAPPLPCPCPAPASRGRPSFSPPQRFGQRLNRRRPAPRPPRSASQARLPGPPPGARPACPSSRPGCWSRPSPSSSCPPS